MHARVRRRVELIVQVVLAEAQHRHEVGAVADRELHEALAPLEHKAQCAGLRVERLRGTAHDDRDGAAHALAVDAAAAEEVGAGLARDGVEADGQGPVAVEGDAEVGVEREQGVGYAWEELGEAEGLGGEGGEGAVRDDAVGVVAEDVFAGRGELFGAVQARGEVGGEEGEYGQAADGFGTMGEVAGGGGVGEVDVDEVRDEKGPQEWDGAEEEKDREEETD